MASRGAGWLVGVIVLCVLAVYANSLFNEFVFDDFGGIDGNPTIRQLWPLGQCSTPCAWSAGLNQQVHTRPLLNFSFALNYALGGLQVWGYHAVNVAIHIANALLLFGILRRTLSLAVVRKKLGDAGVPLSFAVALLWALHPLQTESVTYVIQRAESLVALLYLLTLYCAIRGAEPGRAAAWHAASVIACFLGMATKEVMVTAPVAVLAYDGIFLAGSFGLALRRRAWFYAGLALSWVLLAYLVVSTGELFKLYAESGGSKDGYEPWTYALTQGGVILHYLRLSFWPSPLVLDYDWPVAKGLGEALPSLFAIGALVAATVWGVIARKPWAFAGAWFFLILSPTSSIVPLEDLAFEHRMYLPLAAVLGVTVVMGYAGARDVVSRYQMSPRAAVTIGVVLLVAVAAIFGALTVRRNTDYANQLSIWRDTIVHAPGKARVNLNLGEALARTGRYEEAIFHYRAALRRKANYPEAHNNLGVALVALGQLEEAVGHYREAIRLSPGYAEPYNNLGFVQAKVGRVGDAITDYEQALRLRPGFVEARINLGNALSLTGRADIAMEQYRAALRSDPSSYLGRYNFGVALASIGRTGEAIGEYEMALKLNPGYVDARINLGRLLFEARRKEEALAHFREAVRLSPDSPKPILNLASAEAASGQADNAIAHYREALRLVPGSAEVHNNLGVLLAGKGDFDGASRAFSEALRLNPGYADAKGNLEKLRVLSGQRRN